MHDELKFKIYNKISKKCFKVTRIDYIEKQVYYYDKDEEYYKCTPSEYIRNF